MLLLEKYPNKLNINIYNIESWFGGSIELYNKLLEETKIINIYNKKSLFYFYNKLNQRYFKTDYLIKDNDDIDDIINNSTKPFPNGLIKYFSNKHLLSNILKNK
jgi:hypothetical protein